MDGGRAGEDLGALAIECRTDGRLALDLAGLDDLPTRLAVTAERAVLRGIEASCTCLLYTSPSPRD